MRCVWTDPVRSISEWRELAAGQVRRGVVGRRTRSLIFADLHFEKGSSYARGRQFLPPYDTRATLAAHGGSGGAPQAGRAIIALGDSFHDPVAAERLGAEERGMLESLARAAHFIWITGNHDPHPPAWLGGAVMARMARRRPGLPPRAARRCGAGRSRGASASGGHASPNGAAACGGAVLSPMACACCCRLSAPIPADWMWAMPRSRACSAARFHAYMLGARSGLCHCARGSGAGGGTGATISSP